MKFEVGKVYRHSSGGLMRIIGGLQTTMYGGCLIAESSNESNLRPVGQDEGATVGWTEVSMDRWKVCFS